MAASEAAVSKILCEGCEEEKAVLFCCQCSLLFCEECVEQHKKLKAFLGHRILTLAQLEKERAQRPPPTCAEHDDRPVTKFCRRCNAFLCPKCTGHEAHEREVKSVAEYAPQVRRELEEVVRRMLGRAEELENAGSVAQATAVAVENQRNSLSQAISESFKAARSLLKEREEALIGEVALIAERKTKALHEQREALHKASMSLKGHVSVTNQQIEKASQESLVEMSVKKLKELEKSLKEYEQLHTMPDAVVDINFSPPTLHPHQLGAVYCNNEPTLVTQVPKVVMISKSSEILLRVPQSGDSLSPGAIHVQLASLVHPDKVTNAEVCLHSEENDVYKAVFVPQIRGRHTLTITANGKQVGEEPFNVFVKHYISEESKLVRTFAGFNGPCGITLNPDGELVVVESKSWKRLRTITHKEISNPTGVTFTKDGTIFVCQPHCLLRSDRNRRYWNVIGRQGQNPLQFDSPSSVKAIGDEVYVCDTGNGRVQVLNSNGQFLRAFFTRDVGNPQDITAGEEGLYIVGNCYICLYNQEGALIRKVEITGGPVQNGMVKSVNISGIHNVCVDCTGNVVVTVHSSYSCHFSVVGGVYVFKPTGEYVTQFGTHIATPSGMVIDDDEFVYVCGDGEICVL